MNDNIQKSDNKIIYIILLMLLWSQSILLQYIKAFGAKVPMFGNLVSPGITAFAIIMLLLSLNTILKNIRLLDLAFWLICAIVVLMNYFIYANNRIFIEESWTKWLFIYIPMYFIGITLIVNLDEKIILALNSVSIFTIFAYVIYTFFIGQLSDDMLRSGDMFAAYNLLPHICFVTFYALKEKKIMNIIASVIGFITLPLLGNRGSLLCLAIFIALYVIVIYGKNHPFLLAFLIIVGAVILLYTPIFENLILFFKNIAEKNNMSTRVFDQILVNEISDSNGRDKIASVMWKEISENPLIGKGIMADRAALKTNSYAHNIILELFINYGVILGGALFLWIVLWGFKAIKKSINDYNILCLLFIGLCCGLVKLFMSGSYIQEPFFFLFIGMCIGAIRRKV